jgi:hypothetical protein
MALEGLCGVPRRHLRSEDRLAFGEDQDFKSNGDEFMAAFPNANDPMAIIRPPFVSNSEFSDIYKSLVFEIWGRQHKTYSSLEY